MPYIPQYRRDELHQGEYPQGSGELNFVITDAVVHYLANRPPSYSALNDALGALEGAKLELYRRMAVPYETAKMLAQGDVYPAYGAY